MFGGGEGGGGEGGSEGGGVGGSEDGGQGGSEGVGEVVVEVVGVMSRGVESMFVKVLVVVVVCWW